MGMVHSYEHGEIPNIVLLAVVKELHCIYI